jgi:nucleotide-binding universal stress UspA family protein
MHLPDERRADQVLGVGERLAASHDAHLIGLFLMPPDIYSPAFSAARGLMEAGKKALRARAQHIADRFEAAGAGLQLKKEWRFIEPGTRSGTEVLMSHVRSADLVIVPQRQPDWDDSLLLEYPEDIALGSGRPTIMVPNAGTFTNIGKRITVAWNDRREAARATFDALPMLRKAESVRLLWINPEQETAPKGDLPTAEIAAALARHGVRCTCAEVRGSDLRVGDALLNQVGEDGTDLLVMGAYGRSRFRELVFGGATRHILKHMTVPVLLSH